MNKTLFVGHNETIKADDIEINSHDYKTTNWSGDPSTNKLHITSMQA